MIYHVSPCICVFLWEWARFESVNGDISEIEYGNEQNAIYPLLIIRYLAPIAVAWNRGGLLPHTS